MDAVAPQMAAPDATADRSSTRLAVIVEVDRFEQWDIQPSAVLYPTWADVAA